MKTNLLLGLILLLRLPVFSQNIDMKVNKLLSHMTLEEKVGQMTQLTVESFLKKNDKGIIIPDEIDEAKLEEYILKYHIGSFLNVGSKAQSLDVWHKRIKAIQETAAKTRLKIPVLYGIDAIHGNGYTQKSVLYPQPIAQAATFNTEIVKNIAEATAYETRAAFIPWTFSPAMDLGRNPVWPRLWESFGEDPLVNATLGTAAVRGYEGNSAIIDKYHVASCLKHYIGYGFPLSGHDRTQSLIPERELREYFLPPYAEAVKAGAKTIMVNSAEINGVPVHANKHLITDILKSELNFKGFVVSDWEDIIMLYKRHKVADDNKEAIAMCINAGVDMSMVPHELSFCKDLIALVKEGKVSLSRIEDAVRRILKVKFELGLFDQPCGKAEDYPDFNSATHTKLNYDAASEAITLLRNEDNILPLNKNVKIFVTGPTANTMNSLNAGWSRMWQGINSNETDADKNTILEAVKNVFSNVDYEPGATFAETKNIQQAVAKAKLADVILLCIGEDTYTETPGNINGLEISEAQIDLVRALAAVGKPIVFILAEGRPRVISKIEPFAKAVVHTYWLGNEGGNAVADVLSGKINPSGKLPYTYPRFTNSLHNYYRKYADDKEFDPAGYNPQWEFGYGLSYTTFKYSNLKLSSNKLTVNENLIATVDVTNTGRVSGKESVLMYVSDLVASITPEVKRLRAFEKIELAPGQTKTVKFTINKNDLSFINADLKRVTEAGQFEIAIGDLKEKFIYQP